MVFQTEIFCVLGDLWPSERYNLLSALKTLDRTAFVDEEFAVEREIKLDGGEITILKALGLSGSPVNGKILMQRSGGMMTAELLDTLTGLMSQGYVLSSKVNVQYIEDVERSIFRVNSSYSRDLRDALKPGGRKKEERSRRRRN
jgi:hypothetical protein